MKKLYSKIFIMKSLQLQILIASLFFCLLGSIDVNAQACREDTIVLNTGYDPLTGMSIPAGTADSRWRVIADPDPSTVEPRPAWAIVPHPAWAPALPNTSWVSSYPTNTNNTNGGYTFEYCFCMEPGLQNPEIHFGLRADDYATVFFNGALIGNTPNPGFNTPMPTPFSIVNPFLFAQGGKNCLQIVNTNAFGVAMGFDLQGFATANSLTMLQDTCCNDGGRITGVKFNDLNGNGAWDPFEPELPGWDIVLTNGTSVWNTTTDASGYYYFNALLPGTYTVSEINQPGWTQTFPAGATHTVSLGMGDLATNINFGNYSGPPPSVCDKADYSIFPAAQPNVDCCWRLNIDNGMLDYFTSLSLVGQGGVTLSYNPGSISPGWTDIASGANFVQLAPPTTYVPTGSTPGLIQFCVGNITSSPQEVFLNWYGPGGDIECIDTLVLNCPPMPAPCAYTENDAIICDQGQPVLEFSLYNPPAAAWDIEAFTINVVSGGSVTPTFFTTTPIAAGSVGGPFQSSVTGIPGSTICYTVTVYNADPNDDPNALRCTTDTICLQIPYCDPCGGISTSVQGNIQDCCWSINLTNSYAPGYFYGVETEILTPGVYFSSIVNPPGSGWTYNTSTPYSTSNVQWNLAPPSGAALPMGTTSLPSFCLDGFTTAPQVMLVKWLAIDGTVCTDTLEFDCPPPPINVCDSTDMGYYPVAQPNDDCCWIIDTYNGMPNYFTALELEGLGGVTISYNPADINPMWTDNSFGPNFVQLVPAAPLTYAPTGPTPGLIEFCVGNVTTSPQQVILKWYGPNFTVECTDTLTIDCDPPIPPCAYTVNDTIICEQGLSILEFSIHNPTTATWDVESFMINTISGGTVTPAYFTTAPITPGSTAGPFQTTLTGTPGTNYCYTVTVHEDDIAVNPNAACCTTDTTCLIIPECDPCERVSASVQGNVQDCCWSINLNNGYAPGYFYGIETEILTPGVYFSSIINPPGSGWTFNTSTPYSNSNVQWNLAPPSGTTLPLGITTLPNFCMSGYTTTPQVMVIKWLAVDGTMCTDTLEFDCPPPPPPIDCADFIKDTITCNPDGTFNFNFAISNYSGQTINAVNLHTFAPSGITITPNPIGLGTVPHLNSSLMQTVNISGPDAIPGATICFKYTVHEYDAAGNPLFCCTPNGTICITLPNCCCDEDQSIVTNGSFTGGLAPWIPFAGSPQHQAAVGCDALGSAQMWGNQVVGEAIQQNMTFIAGQTYQVSYCAKWWNNNPALPPVVRLKMRAATATGATTFTACPAGDCEIVDISPDLTVPFQTFCFDWTPANNYSRVIIQPENNFAVNDGNFVSWLHVDDVCIQPTDVVVPCEMDANDDFITVNPLQSTLINILLNDVGSSSACPVDPCSVTIITPPLNGSVFLGGAPGCQVAYSPNPGAFGTDCFEYSVCDACGCCDTARVCIKINNKPIAVDDSVDLPAGTATPLYPIANDADPDGPLDPCDIQIITQPANGILILGDAPACGLTYLPHNGFEGTDSFEYGICDSLDLCDSALVNIVVHPWIADVGVEVLLEGPYDATTGLMNDDLRIAGLIPQEEPYTMLGYERGAAQGGEMFDPLVLGQTGPSAIVDWVLIELRSATDPEHILTTQAGLIQRDGRVISAKGEYPMKVRMPAIEPVEYLVSVRHRNHLSVISPQICVCCNGICSNGFSQLNIPGQTEVAPGVYAMTAGDATGNDEVESGDRSMIWNDRNSAGYMESDVDMNGVVESGDRSIAWNNRNKMAQMP